MAAAEELEDRVFVDKARWKTIMCCKLLSCVCTCRVILIVIPILLLIRRRLVHGSKGKAHNRGVASWSVGDSTKPNQLQLCKNFFLPASVCSMSILSPSSLVPLTSLSSSPSSLLYLFSLSFLSLLSIAIAIAVLLLPTHHKPGCIRIFVVIYACTHAPHTTHSSTP